MKKVIFMVINMNVGGTEKALLNMLEEMPKDKYEITIFMLEKSGGFLEEIPDHVHIKYFNNYHKLKPWITEAPRKVILKQFQKGHILSGIILIFIFILSKITGSRALLFKYILKNVQPLKNKYDVAIAYAGPMDFISYFVVHKILANKKIQWIHFDVSKIGFTRKFASRIYSQFDQIYVVSHEAKNKLLQILPELKNKVGTFTNRLSRKQLQSQAAKGVGFEDDFKGVRILTVGRLSKEKGQDLIIPILAELKKIGLHVKWYCVGEGSARKEYETMIKELDLTEDFILLGEKTNPYPFMKECDIYVQPSRHEGYCITLAEVKCFDKPIISTNFTGVDEHITDEESGVIVPFKQEEMYNALIRKLTSYKFNRQSSIQ